MKSLGLKQATKVILFSLLCPQSQCQNSALPSNGRKGWHHVLLPATKKKIGKKISSNNTKKAEFKKSMFTLSV